MSVYELKLGKISVRKASNPIESFCVWCPQLGHVYFMTRFPLHLKWKIVNKSIGSFLFISKKQLLHGLITQCIIFV